MRCRFRAGPGFRGKFDISTSYITSSPTAAALPRPAWSRRASSIGAWSSYHLGLELPTRGVKISPKSGPSIEPAPHKLDGPSIKPSIHIRARHQAKRYIPLALGCSVVHSEPNMSSAARVQVMQKPYRARFEASAGAVGSNLASLLLPTSLRPSLGPQNSLIPFRTGRRVAENRPSLWSRWLPPSMTVAVELSPPSLEPPSSLSHSLEQSSFLCAYRPRSVPICAYRLRAPSFLAWSR